jgi:hypothetical protein
MDTTKKLTKELTQDQKQLQTEIDRLIKSFIDLLEKLGKEPRFMGKDKKQNYRKEIIKAERQLQDFKEKSGEDADLSAKFKLNTLLGSIKNLYSGKTGQSLPTPQKKYLVGSSTSIQEPRPQKSPSQPPKKPEINSTSIVWFIALILLL